MYSLTQNEARLMDFLIRNFKERNSINEIGRRLNISHTGAHKILRKLEPLKIVKPEKIGNAIYYKANFEEEIGKKLGEFILSNKEMNPYSKVMEDDLKPLKDIVSSCVLFGSVLRKGREARDIDILLVFEVKDLKKVKNKLNEIRELNTKKIHDAIQTKEDLAKNIRKSDKVILDIIKNGQILWGSEVIVEAIINGTS